MSTVGIISRVSFDSSNFLSKFMLVVLIKDLAQSAQFNGIANINFSKNATLKKETNARLMISTVYG